MKFGKMLRRQELRTGPCAGMYVDYKRLKGILKRLAAAEAEPAQPANAERAHAEFFEALRGEADKVDRTYAEQAAALRARMAPVLAAIHAATAVDSAVLAEFGDMCRQIDNLRAYTLLNFMACCKAMKKYDKKLQQARSADVLGALQSRSFYRSDLLAALLVDAEVAAALVSGEKPREEDFSCGICLGVLSNPVVLSCAHKYCWSCLARAAQFGEACPTCRKALPLDPRYYRVDTSLQRFLSQSFPDHCRHEPGHATEFARDDDDDGDEDEDEEERQDDRAMHDVDLGDDGRFDASKADDRFEAAKPQPAGAPDPAAGTVTPLVVSRLEELLEHCVPGAYVALDLDETVVMAPSPSSMFCARGVELFQDELRALAAPYHAKVELCRRFQAMLDAKVPVQRNTVDVVRDMQKRGCWVFGLTARYSTMAHPTQVLMEELGLDLCLAQPAHLSRDQALQDPDTGALFSGGVVFTNAVDKGLVLSRFLRYVVGLGERTEVPVPPAVLFADDRVSNCDSVLGGLAHARGLGAVVRAFHYTGAENVHAAQHDAAEADAIMRQQARHFFTTRGGVQTDADAIAALAGSRTGSTACSVS